MFGDKFRVPRYEYGHTRIDARTPVSIHAHRPLVKRTSLVPYQVTHKSFHHIVRALFLLHVFISSLLGSIPNGANGSVAVWSFSTTSSACHAVSWHRGLHSQHGENFVFTSTVILRGVSHFFALHQIYAAAPVTSSTSLIRRSILPYHVLVLAAYMILLELYAATVKVRQSLLKGIRQYHRFQSLMLHPPFLKVEFMISGQLITAYFRSFYHDDTVFIVLTLNLIVLISLKDRNSRKAVQLLSQWAWSPEHPLTYLSSF